MWKLLKIEKVYPYIVRLDRRGISDKMSPMKRKTQKTDYCCPVCDCQLLSVTGDSLNPLNGITLYCPNGDPDAKKHPQEVSGHGKNEKIAYDIIRMKFTNAKVEVNTEE